MLHRILHDEVYICGEKKGYPQPITTVNLMFIVSLQAAIQNQPLLAL
jgi:hypothetical protein